MRLTVLGSSGSYPGKLRHCSGYLVQENDTNVLLDCGTGVLSHMLAHIPLQSLTGVVITHMHADHFLDLIPLRYALVYGNHNRSEALPVFLPPGGISAWEKMVEMFHEPNKAFSQPFDLKEYTAGRNHSLGGLDIQFALLRHFIPNYGVEVRGSTRLVYSGDTGPSQELTNMARGADLLLCEATWLKDEAPPEQRGHLTAREAGEIAMEAGVKKLLLTHISPNVDAVQALRAAKAVFRGDVQLAEEGKVYQVYKVEAV